jgi:hypothetical protein
MSICTSDVFSLARKRITKAPNLTSWWWNYKSFMSHVFRYIGYCLHRINLLHDHGVVLLLVFDADVLSMKAEGEVKHARC